MDVGGTDKEKEQIVNTNVDIDYTAIYREPAAEGANEFRVITQQGSVLWITYTGSGVAERRTITSFESDLRQGIIVKIAADAA